jgi:hypothetical protein
MSEFSILALIKVVMHIPKRFVKAFMPNILKEWRKTWVRDLRAKVARGEIDPESLLALSDILRKMSQSLQAMLKEGILRKR